MCINKKWIVNKVTGERVFISCGKCEACQQSKANRRTLRINLESKFGVPSDYCTVLVTLTYNDMNVPFIFQNDYRDFVDGLKSYLPVYRLQSYKDYRLSSSFVKRPIRSCRLFHLDTFDNYILKNKDFSVSGNFLNQYYYNHSQEDIDLSLPFLRTKLGIDNSRVGVLYYKDVQDFLKRLKQNLIRVYHVKDSFHFFSVGEYGPKTYRPHYHLLLHFPSRRLEEFKNAVVSSWKFDNIGRNIENQFKVVDNAASYVSTYVNCSSDFPPFFKDFKYFRPSHHYSKGYGLVSQYCRLPFLLSCIDKSSFFYKRSFKKNGIKQVGEFPLPAFVINKYFPKFKGFNRLTGYEILELFKNPRTLYDYQRTLDYSYDDIKKIKTSLYNAYENYCNILHIPISTCTLEDYSYHYYQIWKSYKSFLIRLSYKDIDGSDRSILEHFVNWEHRNHQLVCDVLNKYVFHLFETDPNKYVSNQVTHNYLLELYHSYDKSKRVKNSLIQI